MAHLNLFRIVMAGNLDLLKAFVSGGGDVNTCKFKRISSLMLAIQGSSKDYCVQSQTQRVPISDEFIILLLRSGAKINVFNSYLETPLILAVKYKNSIEVVRAIVGRSRSIINLKCVFGKTALIHAFENNCDSDIIELLIKEGADVNITAHGGWSPLFFAVKFNYCSSLIKLLIEAGADPLVCDDAGMNLLMRVNCYCCCDECCRIKPTVDLLLHHGVDLKRKDLKGNTIIHSVNCNYLIDLAIGYGVSVDAKNDYGITPLMDAVVNNNFKKITNLLSYNIDPNCTDSMQRTPLHHFSILQANEIVKKLLFKGANLFARNTYNCTPIDLLFDCNIYRNPNYINGLAVVIKHFLFYINNEFILQERKRKLLDEHGANVFRSFFKHIKEEIPKMKRVFITNSLTFFDFCMFIKSSKSKLISISIDDYIHDFDFIKSSFPLYHDFIMMRIKANHKKKCRRILLKCLQNIKIFPIQCNRTGSPSHLGYDCLYLIGCNLNDKQLYNFFRASILT